MGTGSLLQILQAVLMATGAAVLLGKAEALVQADKIGIGFQIIHNVVVILVGSIACHDLRQGRAGCGCLMLEGQPGGDGYDAGSASPWKIKDGDMQDASDPDSAAPFFSAVRLQA